MSINFIVAQNIKTERNKRQYSQEYMAMKLDRSQNAYSKLELGRSKLTLEQLYKIAEIFGVAPTYFLPNEESLKIAV